MTINPWTLATAFAAGTVLGAVFFGGLWWTVRRGLASKRPALWFLGSLAVRMGLVLLGFYVVSGGHWERLLACLVGFLFARLVVARVTRLPENRAPAPQAKEARHAA